MKYYISAGLRTLAFFIILPVATNYLPKAEVGRFFFWLAVIQVGAGLTTLGFSSAVSRRAYNNRIVDYLSGAGLGVAVLMWCIVGLIGSSAGALSASVLAAWLARSLSMLGEARCLALRRYGTLSVGYTIYAAALPSIGLVMAMRTGATYQSLLAAFIVAEAVIALLGLRGIRITLRSLLVPRQFRFLQTVKRSAAYGLPIMVAGLATMGLNSFDRFIVTGFHGFEVVAEFSIMYTIAFASSRFITAPANMKIFPEFVRGYRQDVVMQEIRSTAGIAWLTSVSYCVVIAVTGPIIVKLVLGESYALERLDFVLVSAASSMFLLFTINSSHLKLQNRTSIMMLVLFAGLAVNVSVSLGLVPSLGYRGASISTFCAYGLLALWAALRLKPILFDRNALFAGLVILAVLITVAALA